MEKLLFVANKDNNFYNFRREVILAFKEKGFEVVLVCPYGKKIDFFTERGCRFLNIEINRRGKNVFQDLQWCSGFRRILKEEKPAVVLTYTTKSSIYAGIVSRLLGVPYIINNAGLLDNDNTFLGKFLRILYRISFSGAKCMMYQNRTEQAFFNSLLRNKVNNRLLPGSGVNVDYFKYEEYPQTNTPVVFNYVSRIEKDKGIEEMISCAIRIKSKYPETQFRLFGDYDEMNYKTEVERLHKEGVVVYEGTKMDLRPFIKDCHCVIHPSYHEGMTNVILEHGAAGRPSIASDIPGCKEGIDNGLTGYTFTLKDVDDLVDKVEHFILLSLEEKKAMGLAARKKMEREFDRGIVTNIYMEEVDMIITHSK